MLTKQWCEKNNMVQKKEVGLIAQEATQVAPEVVSQVGFVGNDKLYAVSYERLVPYLIASIQQLTHEIDILKKMKRVD